MSIIFQTIFNILRKRENEAKKASSQDDNQSATPSTQAPRPFYPASASEDGAEEAEPEEDGPSNE